MQMSSRQTWPAPQGGLQPVWVQKPCRQVAPELQSALVVQVPGAWPMQSSSRQTWAGPHGGSQLESAQKPPTQLFGAAQGLLWEQATGAQRPWPGVHASPAGQLLGQAGAGGGAEPASLPPVAPGQAQSGATNGTRAQHFTAVPPRVGLLAREYRVNRSKSTVATRVPWAELLRRVWHLEALRCERRGGRLRPVALIQDPAAAERYLRARGEFTTLPGPARSRGPPAAAA